MIHQIKSSKLDIKSHERIVNAFLQSMSLVKCFTNVYLLKTFVNHRLRRVKLHFVVDINDPLTLKWFNCRQLHIDFHSARIYIAFELVRYPISIPVLVFRERKDFACQVVEINRCGY